MKRYISNITLIIIGFLLSQTGKTAKMELSEYLKPLHTYIGKTFKGEFADSTPENPTYDIQYWERALNGNAIKITHSVNNGEYGGESMIMWDPKLGSQVSWYFTTAGFYTQATVIIEDGKLVSHENVTGNENGITEVKSIMQLLSNGQLHTKSEYLQNGKWVDGHEIYYKEAPGEQVIFK